ncbi:hypothetical protein Tco_1165229 [Tanacetum coccineum]
MIQPEPEDLPKDNPKLEIAVLSYCNALPLSAIRVSLTETMSLCSGDTPLSMTSNSEIVVIEWWQYDPASEYYNLLCISSQSSFNKREGERVSLRILRDYVTRAYFQLDSLLTIKHLAKIDPKDKGRKRKLKRKMSLESEFDGIPELKRSLRACSDEENGLGGAKKNVEGERERKRLAEEEAYLNDALLAFMMT